MAGHISQYFLLGILCIALVLASGSKIPSLSECVVPTPCVNPNSCNAECSTSGYQRGVCLYFPPQHSWLCCCV
ncbi:hypothetical protein MtrunA17_Chr3g0098011 [Medicago truncatula]|uniref:LCR-like protein n=1 Tax=Medicago truncatula TaxID=3880 RepID=G7J1B2_MEDTR|nr:LCR-like protein [Medicago truncatula]RHN67009.1 hypothetical protein MtrunA17_Chr3g0098011 [Medicago truncatula]